MTERQAVDFDSTLTQANVAYWDSERPEPDPDVCEAVRQAYCSGATVIAWTARSDIPR